MTSTPVATVFSGDRKFLLGRSRSDGLSYFGGPGCDQVIEGPRYGPRRLHHLLTLNHTEFGIHAPRFGCKVSFYYGLCFEGCELDWERKAPAAIRITRMDPRKSGKEYPYFGYPDVLPYFPLEIVDHSAAGSSDLEAAIGNTSWEPSADRVYVIAHSHPELGVALVSPDENVDIAFEYDPASGKVRAEGQAD